MNQRCFHHYLVSLVLLHQLQLWVSLGVTMADSSHCFYCREDLGGKRFVRNEGKPVCVRCHTKFCANNCAECHRPIPVESKVRLSSCTCHQVRVLSTYLSSDSPPSLLPPSGAQPQGPVLARGVFPLCKVLQASGQRALQHQGWSHHVWEVLLQGGRSALPRLL